MKPFSAFVEQLGIEDTLTTAERVEGYMPLSPALHQPFGVVHGGATISFLETLASRGAIFRIDPERERAFGADVHVRHCKPASTGVMRGYAQLERLEGNKQFWEVRAFDDEGDVVSEGVIITKIVTLERLAQRAAEAQKAKELQRTQS